MNFGSMEMGLSGARSNFRLANYLAGLSQSVYYDFTKTDRNFTTSTGPTLVASYGDAIGLSLDSATWGGKTLTNELAGQSEIISNPGNPFVTTADYLPYADTGTATLSVVSEKLRVFQDASTSYGRAVIAISGLVVGDTYRLLTSGLGGTANSYTRVTSSSNGSSVGSVLDLINVAADNYFVANATTMYVTYYNNTANPNTYVEIGEISVLYVPGYPATQSSSTLRPTWQSTGCKFDGVDDYLGTNYTAGSGSNFMVALVTVPSSISGTSILAGERIATTTNFYIGFNASGQLLGGIGIDGQAIIHGTNDLRGRTLVVGITCDGSTVNLFEDNAIVYSAAQNGSPATTVSLNLGCLNDNGTPGNYFGGSIDKFPAGTDYLTLSRYLQIRQALLAA